MARRDLFRSARDRADQSATSVWGLLMFPEQTSERGKIAAKKLYAAISAATHRLADLEAFELRMVEVELLVLAGARWARRNASDLVHGAKMSKSGFDRLYFPESAMASNVM